MMRFAVVIAVAVAGGAAVIASVIASRAQDTTDWPTRERGLYLMRIGDCAACHTVDPDRPLAGGYALQTPFGVIYSRNITPDPETGLGRWDADDFWRAMNRGISRDGSRLYPAFPYTHFTNITRQDSDALFAYLKSVAPVRNRVREPDFFWPLNWRFVMRFWNFVSFDDKTFRPDPQKSEAWNRGKYLVEGLAHCGLCHSPKNVLGAVEDGAAAYTGGLAEGWWAPSITSSRVDGIGDWSAEELARFLKTGRNGRAVAFGPMAEVVRLSTSHLTDEDLAAVVAYVRSIPAQETAAREPVARDGPAMTLGGLIYDTQCSACHGPKGQGVENQFARLANSALVGAENPRTVLRVILEGTHAAVTDGFPTQQAMPPFDWKLTDEEVAAVATYVRNSFGNAAPAVVASEVADLRD